MDKNSSLTHYNLKKYLVNICVIYITMNNTQQEDINIIAKVPSPEEIRKIMVTGDEVSSAITEAVSKRDYNFQNTASHLNSISIDDFPLKNYFEHFQPLTKLSKMSNVPVLVPPSLDANETILAKLASGNIGPGATVREGNVDADGGELTIIGDGNGLFYPLNGQDGAKRSNGPNAVYIPGKGKRINLFSSKGLSVSPSELLTRYINFRDHNIGGIISLTIDMINKPGGRGNLEDYGDKVNDMKLIASLLGKLQDVKTKDELNAAGMDIVSFCQTWDPETGNANFSVMSPHFQNRLFIINPDLLKEKGVSQEEINAFNNALASMTEDPAFLGAYANPPRFINLDELYETGALNKVANAPVANAPVANAPVANAPVTEAPKPKTKRFSWFRKSKGGKKQITRKNKNKNIKNGKKTRKLNKNKNSITTIKLNKKNKTTRKLDRKDKKDKKTRKLNKKNKKTRKLNKRGEKGKKTVRRV